MPTPPISVLNAAKNISTSAGTTAGKKFGKNVTDIIDPTVRDELLGAGKVVIGDNIAFHAKDFSPEARKAFEATAVDTSTSKLSSRANTLSLGIFAIPVFAKIAHWLAKSARIHIKPEPKAVSSEPFTGFNFTKGASYVPEAEAAATEAVKEATQAAGKSKGGFWSFLTGSGKKAAAGTMNEAVKETVKETAKEATKTAAKDKGFWKSIFGGGKKAAEEAVKQGGLKPEPFRVLKGAAYKAGTGEKIGNFFKKLFNPVTKHFNPQKLDRFAEATSLSDVPLNKVGNAWKEMKNGWRNVDWQKANPGKGFDLVTTTATKLGGETATKTAAKTLGSKFGEYAKKLGSKMPTDLKESSVGNAAWAGLSAVGETAQMATTFHSRVQTLKTIMADITGKVPSTHKVLFGKDVPPIIKEIRGEARGGKALAGMGVQLGGSIANVYLMLKSGKMGQGAFFAKSMGVSLGSSMAAGAITASNTTLKAYQEMARSFKQTGKAPVELYVQLIGGVAKHAPEKIVLDVAQKAWQKRMHPGQVMRMLNETSFLTNLPKEDAVQGKFTAALEGKTTAVEDKQVLGKFTQKELAPTPAATAEKQDKGKLVQGNFTSRENLAASADQSAIRA